MNAYDILANRGVTRLCHFTKLKSLTHIISAAEGILASSSIRQDTKNITDVARYDNELDYVCCSVQFPNSWFLKRAMQNNTDKIFKDWVVLYIDLNILKHKSAKFCPCNASKERGVYINARMGEVDSIFAPSIPTFSYPRSPKMPSSCPTDGQAEILIKDNIPRDYIIGIATGNKDVAARIYAMLKMSDARQIPIDIAPDVLTPSWSRMIKDGLSPSEMRCVWSEEE